MRLSQQKVCSNFIWHIFLEIFKPFSQSLWRFYDHSHVYLRKPLSLLLKFLGIYLMHF